MWLVQNGVPWHVAEEMGQVERVAVAAAAAEMRGMTWDWAGGQPRGKGTP